MNKELIEKQIRELDTNNIIESLDLRCTSDSINIIINIYFDCYCSTLDNFICKYNRMTIYDEKYNINFFDTLSNDKTNNFISNNKDKIKQIIKNNL